MAKSHDRAIRDRQDLFRIQVARFRVCADRAPTRADIRLLWMGTGFRRP